MPDHTKTYVMFLLMFMTAFMVLWTEGIVERIVFAACAVMFYLTIHDEYED